MTLRHSFPLIVFAGLIILSGAGLYKHLQGQRDTRQLPAALLNRPPPQIALPTLEDADTLSIQHYHGQMVAVNFFASWCLPCRAEVPALDYLAQSMPVIGIAHKDRPRDTQTFLHQYGNPFTAVLKDQDGRAGLAWGSYGIPETYIVDTSGIIIWRHAGVIDRQLIDNQILPLLQASTL